MATLDLIGIDTTTGQTKRFVSGDTVNGAGTGDMSLSGIQTVTGQKTFNSGTLRLAGSTSGFITLNAASVAGTNTITLPANTGTVVLDSTTSIAGFSWILDEDNMSSNSDTKVPTQQSVKAYVDNAVLGLLDYKGGYNAATNTPDLDTSPSGVLKGDVYTVTAAGTFFTEDLAIGDVIIAEVDNPTTLADWTTVQKNLLDPINAASITLANEATDTSCFLVFSTSATGAQSLYTNSNLSFNSSTGALTLAAVTASNLTLTNGGALRTGTTAADTLLLQAYDVDGAAYTTFATLTAGNDPSFDLASSVTKGGQQIVTPSSTTTFTNKTFDANGTGNSISNIEPADLANGTDGALITWDASGVPTTLAPGDATKVLTSNGAGAVPSYQTSDILLSTTAVTDATATGTTTLYTVPAGKKAVITKAIVRVTAASGATVAGTVNIGVSAGDIFTATQLTGVLAVDDAYIFSNVLGKFTLADAADAILFDIDTGYTATSIALAVDLFGYLV